MDVVLLHDSGMYVFESRIIVGGYLEQRHRKIGLDFANGKENHKESFLLSIMQNKGHIKWLKSYKTSAYQFLMYSF